ncbi:formate dehydrogenase accessory sulfurtransferase FdhD [Pelotomaculum propionicicum]|uniref:Sulfur carrier protein FdhD n=1 Tax=Pelotomaculum propionicicum TaxID=258475 RepID=A0A4Y7RRL9_9FIRM|nr:formate dehydrogenase accessory sulfurtransferase FdhD [Pelotomaculum propionicicum]NLI13890.1 formate dehydrogenase accessory sulfurtransferase FdhD [Peptococcaceae bacterium]TEB11426.1 Sulfurtransferase FdhD [Pelotomaculum propionicicum]
MSLPEIYEKREIVTCNRGQRQSDYAFIVKETPLTVFLNDTELATLICSPGAHKELAVGFLLSEGLVRDLSDIREITFNEQDGLLWVETPCAAPETENFLRRQIASCCGKGRVAPYFINDARQLQPVQSTCRFAASRLLALIGILEEGSASFRLTGGVHSAALADHTGLLAMYEDIGRHNAVDKALGYAFLNRTATADKCLLLSGRVSSEILIKAARQGLPLVVSRSAPTLLAVDLAEQYGVALVGFARGERLSVYSHAEKIIM